MQQALFTSQASIEEYPQRNRPNLTTEIDRRQLAYSDDRWHCIKAILCEQYLWDMRCWNKPRHLYTRPEIAVHIQQWLKDEEEGNWTCNCSGCLYCIRKLLVMKWATIEEITSFVQKNYNIQFPNEIGTWGEGISE